MACVLKSYDGINTLSLRWTPSHVVFHNDRSRQLRSVGNHCVLRDGVMRILAGMIILGKSVIGGHAPVLGSDRVAM